jgi:hypothetical protein
MMKKLSLPALRYTSLSHFRRQFAVRSAAAGSNYALIGDIAAMANLVLIARATQSRLKHTHHSARLTKLHSDKVIFKL